MRTIGMLLGIPEEDQEAIRDRLDAGMHLADGSKPPDPDAARLVTSGDGFEDYIDWRATHPSDDLMTDLLNAEFEDVTGETRKLTREEVLNYVGLIAGAGNETTTATDRLDGQGAGRASRPAPRARRGPVAHPERDRGAPALRGAVTGPVALRDARRRALRTGGARGQRHGAAHGVGQPRRPQVRRPATVSTSTARSTTTSRSATASTSAWAAISPGSKAGSRSRRCSSASRPGRSTGTTPNAPHTSTVHGWQRLPVTTTVT